MATTTPESRKRRAERARASKDLPPGHPKVEELRAQYKARLGDYIGKAPALSLERANPCPACGTSPCLALVRADMPPTGWLDFLDRTITRLSSGHWTVRQSCHLLVIFVVLVTVGALAVLVVTHGAPAVIGYAAHVSWGWAYLVGGGTMAAGGIAARRIRTRRAPGGGNIRELKRRGVTD